VFYLEKHKRSFACVLGYTYVRPILEYNSVVWSPILKCEIDALERVQRRFTKRHRGIDLPSYCDRLGLTKLELNTLELRRLHNDLVMLTW